MQAKANTAAGWISSWRNQIKNLKEQGQPRMEPLSSGAQQRQGYICQGRGRGSTLYFLLYWHSYFHA